MHYLKKIPSWIKRSTLALAIIFAAFANQAGCPATRGGAEVLKGVNTTSIGAAGAGQQLEREGPGIKHRSRERNRLLEDENYEPDQNPYPPGDPRNPKPVRQQVRPPKTPTRSGATTTPRSHSHH